MSKTRLLQVRAFPRWYELALGYSKRTNRSLSALVLRAATRDIVSELMDEADRWLAKQREVRDDDRRWNAYRRRIERNIREARELLAYAQDDEKLALLDELDRERESSWRLERVG